MLVKSQVKYIQSLGQKKLRDEANVFVAEGPKIIAELISEMPDQVLSIYATSEWLQANKTSTISAEIIEVSNNELERISQLTTPNEVLALIRKPMLPPAIEVKGRISLALDGIQDPGNLGTIIRTADWFGISQIVCSPNCADVYNSKVIQSSMGSIARVRVYYLELKPWLESEVDISMYGATLDGTDIRKVEKFSEGIIVIGNESKGISQDIMDMLKQRITIPRKGRAESLNAAVATAIILSYIV